MSTGSATHVRAFAQVSVPSSELLADVSRRSPRRIHLHLPGPPPDDDVPPDTAVCSFHLVR